MENGYNAMLHQTIVFGHETIALGHATIDVLGHAVCLVGIAKQGKLYEGLEILLFWMLVGITFLVRLSCFFSSVVLKKILEFQTV